MSQAHPRRQTGKDRRETLDDVTDSSITATVGRRYPKKSRRFQSWNAVHGTWYRKQGVWGTEMHREFVPQLICLLCSSSRESPCDARDSDTRTLIAFSDRLSVCLPCLLVSFTTSLSLSLCTSTDFAVSSLSLCLSVSLSVMCARMVP